MATSMQQQSAAIMEFIRALIKYDASARGLLKWEAQVDPKVLIFTVPSIHTCSGRHSLLGPSTSARIMSYGLES
jgi:hypothetical protein